MTRDLDPCYSGRRAGKLPAAFIDGEPPMFSMKGKVCVVTGAGRGLGRGIALAYAKQGADVVLASRTRADLDEVAGLVTAKGGRALVRVADVSDLAQIQGLADAAVAEFGRIDVWVNNAGGFSAVKGATSEWLDVTGGGPPRARHLLPAARRRSARRRRRRRRLFRLRRGGMGLGRSASRIGRIGDDERPLSLPDAGQQGVSLASHLNFGLDPSCWRGP